MPPSLSGIRRVAIGSTNPVKIAAVPAVLTPLVPQQSIMEAAVDSPVPDQPWGDEETIRGACSRATLAPERFDADLGVGIEGRGGPRGRRAHLRLGRGRAPRL